MFRKKVARTGHDHLGDIMSFEQVSKYIYSDLSYAGNKDQSHLITNVFKLNWDFKDLVCNEGTIQAFIHKSFKHENKISFGENEKLEFFGDAILQLLVSEYLFLTFKELNEGELSKLRSQMVNEQSLSHLARTLNLQKWILLGKGELKENGQDKPSILSDTFEAVLGALYLQDGLDRCRKFLMDTYTIFAQEKQESFIEFVRRNSQDAKTVLQEKVMKKYKTTPEYRTTNFQEKGKNSFQVELWVNNINLGQETHFSKKKAMQMVAKKALENNLI